ncbi:MAG: helix-turn-helix transcriptional regulator [Treponema sp.]|uniref:ArsR/SmtB family transcription factor n=1 Tax=Treponema sp. TaxID=166 RepID=UPI001B440896|nr:metalloregulator ArsR/SmtB family transcription factor [Treponema sp.]MBP5587494.1 helix-turn-helix transcriptional regulator [Treponema sp.]MBR0154574.1 helix-turn-helix transcriptional regulator [Treponema sp.]MCR5387427.1 ArsR family transcriptional regulator [Treponema sp.]
MDLKEFHETLKTFNTCCPLFIAFSDKYRQQLIFDIIEAGKEGINVTNLSAKSHLSRPAISHHLKVLKDSGIVTPKKVGTQIFYQVTLSDKFDTLRQLMNSILMMLDKIQEADGTEK